jgi:arylsulfatase A-like enzyme
LQDEDADALLGEPMSRSAYRDLGNRDVQGGVRVPTADLDNVPAHVHQSHWCTEMALEFIDKNRREDQPWMLSVNPFDPHPPFDPPLEYYARFDAASLPLPHFEAGDLARQRRLHEAGVDFQSAPAEQDPVFARQRSACYLAMIEQLDHEFGRLLDHLEAIGQRQNTLVIFCSDHGETLGDHGLVLKGCRFYEGAMRVPLMIAGPGVRQPGRVSDALVELTDLAPTIYDAVGEATPWWVQGASLGPLLRADAAAAPAADAAHRSHVRAEYRGAIDFPDQTNATMYRDRQYKLVTYHGKGIHELYDLDADPWEHQDLAGAPAHQALLQEMLQQNFDATVAASAPVPPRIANY